MDGSGADWLTTLEKLIKNGQTVVTSRHLIIRGALAHTVRRGLVMRNVALVADAPKLRSIPKVEQQAWAAEELQAFLRAAAGRRLFPAFWLSAMTGIRRNELLGLRWTDLDTKRARLSINRGLVAVGYNLYETRGKTKTSRRCIALDPTTILVLSGWRALPEAHRRDTAHRRRRAGQGRLRTTWSRQPDVHNRDVPARAAGNAGRRGPHHGSPRHGSSSGHPAGSESRLNNR